MAGKKSVQQWEEMFKSADKDGSGTLDIHELKDMLKLGNSNLKDSQIADTFVYFDGPGGDKKITLDEFTKGMNKFEAFYKQLEDMFKAADKDGSGCLNRAELTDLLKKTNNNFSNSEITEILNDADKNNDGNISFREFLEACT